APVAPGGRWRVDQAAAPEGGVATGDELSGRRRWHVKSTTSLHVGGRFHERHGWHSFDKCSSDGGRSPQRRSPDEGGAILWRRAATGRLLRALASPPCVLARGDEDSPRHRLPPRRETTASHLVWFGDPGFWEA